MAKKAEGHGKWDRDKPTDRKEFCWNCFHWEKAHHEKPCDTCFGYTKTGKFYAYKHWKEGIDYVES